MADLVPLLLRLHDSHAYPGCRASAGTLPPPPFAARPCLIEFSDGAGASGALSMPGAEEMHLAIAAYRTMRGHRIAAKSWLLRSAQNPPGEGWKVARRMS
ncbi:hypothetical protein [Roseomonas sp. KE0001]|uniref:hypothetical protein n=1 Tax=unclassified Roseomonas TaxID=2617492 RepID=UPI0018DEF7A4|nr:hypothetical protein [Roseomonas sp. KE0001]MBI0434102.1 hypothetical protein [Roseomonas sp. KE0001]